jgi:cytochrome oxidase assembly protein ShyY1
MTIRGRQVLIGIGGAVVTMALLALGLWQMRVFEDREAYNAQARAALPVVQLVDYVGPDGAVGDVYGKRTTVTGHYLPDQQVRGLGPGDGAVPPPPSGTVTQAGIFLPTEAAADHPVPAGSYASVRLPQIVQEWPQQLLPGFVTLDRAQADAQGLYPATAVLPTGEGSLQNLGYALQWWVFAAFAAFMTWRFVRVLGRRGRIGSLAEQEDL